MHAFQKVSGNEADRVGIITLSLPSVVRDEKPIPLVSIEIKLSLLKYLRLLMLDYFLFLSESILIVTDRNPSQETTCLAKVAKHICKRYGVDEMHIG